jgi:type I restriction enzyme R subunit
MFDHPVKQYALFKAFEARLDERQTPGVPEALHDNPHAKAYFGAIRLVVGERWDVQSEAAFVDEARAIDHIVKTAVAENSLNPQNIEAAIRKELLPRLFGMLGLEAAKSVIDQVVHIARLGLARGA